MVNDGYLFEEFQAVSVVVVSKKQNGWLAGISIGSEPLQSRIALLDSTGFLPLRVLRSTNGRQQVTNNLLTRKVFFSSYL